MGSFHGLLDEFYSLATLSRDVLSGKSQNEFINLIGKEVPKSITDEVKSSRIIIIIISFFNVSLQTF